MHPIENNPNPSLHTMLITTSPTVPGRKILRCHGLVRGNTIRARHVGKDILAFFKNLVGGEIEEYTKLMAESREQAIDRMGDEAKRLGANAVVATYFTTSMVSQAASEILAVGTAVTLAEEDE
jgi:uncharacterized protein YbjQ (UPF0145 family)